ncbi:MAG: RHS repeat-associated core domain-containing protein, partial [Clostridia bacterium]|nr:RHS repeat-associated core domain-containing protein [Clostridia bacterium]
AGGIAAAYDHGPFGEDMAAAGPAAGLNPFRFSSEVWDGALGLVCYTFRPYNPLDGRFISRDPIEERGGLNLYGFVGNDPVNRWDFLEKNLLWRDPNGGEWELLRIHAKAIVVKAKSLSFAIDSFIYEEIDSTWESRFGNLDSVFVSQFELESTKERAAISALMTVRDKLGKIEAIENFKGWKVSRCDTKKLLGLTNKITGNIGIHKKFFKTEKGLLQNIMAHEASHKFCGTRDYFVSAVNKAANYGTVLGD